MNTLKDRLIYVRTLRRMSQKELARQSKCAQSAIGNAESGERKSLRNLIEVARALDCDPGWLYDGKGVKPLAEIDNPILPLLEGKYTPTLPQPPSFLHENVVALTAPPPPDEALKVKLLELFDQLDIQGKAGLIKSVQGFVDALRPHQDGSAPAVAAQK